MRGTSEYNTSTCFLVEHMGNLTV